MQTLDLNLATRPFRNNVLLWAGFVLGTAALLAFAAWDVRAYGRYSEQLEELRQNVDSIESRTVDLERREGKARAAIDRYDIESLRAQTDKANEVIEWKAFSWTRLFNLMAEMQPHNVRMTSIRPIFSVQRREGGPNVTNEGPAQGVPVAIDGVAKTHEDMLALQNALFDHPNFGRVEMQRFNRAQDNEIVFELRFLYYPEAQGEAPADLVAAEEPPPEAQPAAEEAGPTDAAEATEAAVPEAPASPPPDPPRRGGKTS